MDFDKYSMQISGSRKHTLLPVKEPRSLLMFYLNFRLRNMKSSHWKYLWKAVRKNNDHCSLGTLLEQIAHLWIHIERFDMDIFITVSGHLSNTDTAKYRNRVSKTKFFMITIIPILWIHLHNSSDDSLVSIFSNSALIFSDQSLIKFLSSSFDNISVWKVWFRLTRIVGAEFMPLEPISCNKSHNWVISWTNNQRIRKKAKEFDHERL